MFQRRLFGERSYLFSDAHVLFKERSSLLSGELFTVIIPIHWHIQDGQPLAFQLLEEEEGKKQFESNRRTGFTKQMVGAFVATIWIAHVLL